MRRPIPVLLEGAPRRLFSLKALILLAFTPQ